MNLAQTLKILRTKNDLSQNDLALKLNVSRKTVSSWENGRSTPGFEDLHNICHLFDISSNDLMMNKDFSHYQSQTINKKKLQKKLKIPTVIEFMLFIILFIGTPIIELSVTLTFILLLLTGYLNFYSTKFLLPGEKIVFVKKRKKFIMIFCLYFLIISLISGWLLVNKFNKNGEFILGFAYGTLIAASIMIFAMITLYNLFQLYNIHPINKFKHICKRRKVK